MHATRRHHRTAADFKDSQVKGTNHTSRKEEKRLNSMAAFQQHVIPPAAPEEIAFRHGHWQERRTRVRAALMATYINTLALNRFDECGSGCRVEWSETAQRHRLRADYCHNRHCEPCARAKANLIARNLRNKIGAAQQHQYRFITLTLKHSDEPLLQQVQRLYGCFKKLRKTKLWKQSQDGGAFMLEIKHNGAHWHPHLHIISDGSFVRKEDLSREWLKATGDSMIVDIRQLTDPKDAVHYVCKYVSKGTNKEVWQDQATAVEFIIATKGVRACSTFGSWRGFRLLARTADATDWKPVCTLSSLWNRARGGEEHAWQLLKILRVADADPEID